MNKAEREKLTQIIEEDQGTNWWQPKEFEERIRSQLPTELEIISAPPLSVGNYNCFVYTLGLENDQEFLGGQNPIQKEFIRHLLETGVLKLTESPEQGDFIFYEDESHVITHGGIVQKDGSIRSKWMWGALFAHQIWDVPSSFGDNVFYCKAIPSMTVKDAYFAYKESGVEIRPIT